VLAHGFASPRRRGFAIVGNQHCTDSAATIAHAEYAGKSDGNDFSAFALATSRADSDSSEASCRWNCTSAPWWDYSRFVDFSKMEGKNVKM
jgi:hypothetical protein